MSAARTSPGSPRRRMLRSRRCNRHSTSYATEGGCPGPRVRAMVCRTSTRSSGLGGMVTVTRGGGQGPGGARGCRRTLYARVGGGGEGQRDGGGGGGGRGGVVKVTRGGGHSDRGGRSEGPPPLLSVKDNYEDKSKDGRALHPAV